MFSLRQDQTSAAIAAEINRVTTAIKSGDLRERARLDGQTGPGLEALKAVNNLIDTLSTPIQQASAALAGARKGECPNQLPVGPGVLGDLSREVNTVAGALADMASAPLFQSQAAAKARKAGDFAKWVDAIEEKMHWYESLLDAIPFPISVTDMDMAWTFINKPASDVCGKKREEVVGTKCCNWGADICNTERCGIEMLRKGTPTSTFTQPGLDMDFQVDTTYITNRKGEKTGHIEVVQDVTKAIRSRQKTERISEYIQSEVQNFSKVLSRLSQGDLTVHYDVTPSSAETEEAKRYFDAIKVAFDETISRLAGTIQSLRGATNEMNASVTSVASAIEEMTSSLGEVSRSCAQAAATARKANDGANHTAVIVGDLGETARSIDKVVELIRGIASQTNLLALNATIEAASAGDAGKGFAVVAHEVKELAKQTAGATEDIRQQVSAMQSSAGSAVTAVDGIVEVVKEIDAVSGTIAAAVEEQTATINEIALNVVSTTSSAQRSGQNIGVIAERLKEMIQFFKV